jgi:taurine dioxygenase
MPLETRPLTPNFGVEILNGDLSEPIDDRRFAELRDLWLRKKVILLRNQKISEEDMIRFGRRLGEVEIHVRNDATSKTHREVLLVSNKKENGKAIGVLGDAEAPWHSDQIYMAVPTFGTMLYAVNIPREGGNTFVCDMAAAYQTLPEATRQAIAGKRGVQSAAFFNQRYDGGMSAEQLARVPDVAHPLARTHPVLGHKALYLSFGHTKGIEGMSEDESNTLLEALRTHAVQPARVYEHRWRVGDVLMWDNTQTMHRRDPFDPNDIRLLKRISFLCPPDARAPF